MQCLRPLLPIVLACGASAHAQPATTLTIQFSVPVQISDYAAGRAAVWCELLNAAGQPLAPPPTADRQPVGVGRAYVTVSAGAASATVPVAVSVPLESAPLPRGWRCVRATTDRDAPDPRNASTSSIPKDLPVLAEVRGTL